METKWVKRSKVFSKTWFFLVALFFVIIIPLVGLTMWINWGLSPLNTSGSEKVFVIKENEGIPSITKRLQDEGFIRDATVFNLYLKLNCLKINFTNLTKIVDRVSESKCLSTQIQSGSFKISSSMTVQTLALNLTKGRLDSWLTIKEGLRDEEIAATVAEKFHINQDDFLKIAQIGYMFPDTYLFNVNSTASDIATKMRATFDERFGQDLRDKVTAEGLTLDQAVILASIVERDSLDGPDRAIIAGIYIKRFQQGWVLGSDATVQYALGYDDTGKTWWKKDLTDQDVSIDSLFNTRKNTGLPPTPICNPGLSSLTAVAEPVATDYYYYLYDKNNKVHFAKTLDEHNQNKALYLQ